MIKYGDVARRVAVRLCCTKPKENSGFSSTDSTLEAQPIFRVKKDWSKIIWFVRSASLLVPGDCWTRAAELQPFCTVDLSLLQPAMIYPDIHVRASSSVDLRAAAELPGVWLDKQMTLAYHARNQLPCRHRDLQGR